MQHQPFVRIAAAASLAAITLLVSKTSADVISQNRLETTQMPGTHPYAGIGRSAFQSGDLLGDVIPMFQQTISHATALQQAALTLDTSILREFGWVTLNDVRPGGRMYNQPCGMHVLIFDSGFDPLDPHAALLSDQLLTLTFTETQRTGSFVSAPAQAVFRGTATFTLPGLETGQSSRQLLIGLAPDLNSAGSGTSTRFFMPQSTLSADAAGVVVEGAADYIYNSTLSSPALLPLTGIGIARLPIQLSIAPSPGTIAILIPGLFAAACRRPPMRSRAPLGEP